MLITLVFFYRRFLGFLLGSTTAFVASFTYLRNEWKMRDEILMEDFAVWIFNSVPRSGEVNIMRVFC